MTATISATRAAIVPASSLAGMRMDTSIARGCVSLISVLHDGDRAWLGKGHPGPAQGPGARRTTVTYRLITVRHRGAGAGNLSGPAEVCRVEHPSRRHRNSRPAGPMGAPLVATAPSTGVSSVGSCVPTLDT